MLAVPFSVLRDPAKSPLASLKSRQRNQLAAVALFWVEYDLNSILAMNVVPQPAEQIRIPKRNAMRCTEHLGRFQELSVTLTRNPPPRVHNNH